MAIIRVRPSTKAGLKIKLKGAKGNKDRKFFNVDRHTLLEVNDKTGVVKFLNYFYDDKYIKYNGVESLLLDKKQILALMEDDITIYSVVNK
jgi:hypothetical protein